jgi:hypothetical protein
MTLFAVVIVGGGVDETGDRVEIGTDGAADVVGGNVVVTGATGANVGVTGTNLDGKKVPTLGGAVGVVVLTGKDDGLDVVAMIGALVVDRAVGVPVLAMGAKGVAVGADVDKGATG